MKKTSLYNQGMKPCVFSKRKYEESGLEWHRDGEDIAYFQNDMLRVRPNINSPSARNRDQDKQYFMTLTFTYTFSFDEDEVSFAHCYPYDYHRLES